MVRLTLAVFGTRVTIIYKNGTKVAARFRQFDFKFDASSRRAEWKRPLLSWSKEPLWLNVDEIYAIWQGRV